jgi:hypothetical protein
MKKSFGFFAVLVAFVTLPFCIIQCDGSKEKTVEKQGDVQKQADAPKEAQAQSSSMLPKKLLNLGLTDEQKLKCEAAYQEIYSPAVMAQEKEIIEKQKRVDINSAEYIKLEKEISEKSKLYNDQLNQRLKTILTEEQQDKFFGKKAKNHSAEPAKPVKKDKPVQSKPVQVESESPNDQYEIIDTPFGKVKHKKEQ